ncbi:MAG: PA2778 family cysteine peptidase [Gammaproteobacteria bacterium]
MKPEPERARNLACTLFLFLLLGGCATSPQTRLLLDNPPDIPPRVEITDVPFFPQERYHCGPAALAEVINFRGGNVHPDEIADKIYVPELKGSLQVEVVAAARQYDLLPVQLDGRMDSLLRELQAGNPVFVLQNLAIDILPVWHYEVLIGYDFETRDMILRSGTDRRITRSFALFEKTWQRADYWALVLVKPDTIPATASADAWLDAAVGMEQVGRARIAQQAYRTALGRWPDNLLAYSGLGNTAYALGDYAGAESAYRAALEREPDKAAIWNNLAYALAAQGRRADSLDAIRQAIELEPDNPNFAASLAELKAPQ